MATLRNRNNKWQVRVVRKGHPPATKTFQNKQDALRWAREIESAMDKGSFVDHSLAERTTFKEIIERYVSEITPTMRSAREDTFRLKKLARHPLCQLNMAAMTPSRLAKYRDERLQTVSASTVIRELSYFSSIINHARREWGINIINPVLLVKKPATPKGRSRILNDDELNRLFDALKPNGRRSAWMHPIVQFTLETAIRRGELLKLQWSNVDLEKRTARLELTKNGENRTVPLSSSAVEILKRLPRSIDGRVFPMNPAAVAAAFIKAVKRAGIADFHFHDLRHMAITRMAEKLPNVIELSAVSGHKSLAMLKRYYHPDAQLLAQKLG